jgi:thymidylate kinase/thymidylate synthase ThyX
MADKTGFFLVLEGTDGSGKGTQFQLLKERLETEGYDVATFDFPQYEQESSYFVREYLNGKYGTAEEVGPYTGSLFFSLDRYQASSQIKAALEEGKIVLANRFTGSNMAHQGTKFDNPEERKGYFLWLDAIEFQMLGIPRPDLSLVLRVPAETAQKLVDQKGKRNYTDRRRDIHEADLNHLKKSVEVYDNLCQLFPKDFKQLDCVRNAKLMAVETIHNLIWETIQPMLPSKKRTTNKKAVSPYLKENKYGLEVSETGLKKLSDIVTNTTGDVYSFTEKLSPQTIAAAMARLSRRGDDMRITLLDEFIGAAGKDEKLLQRVITAYGDDSVQQLAGLHVVVENASNLLTKKLEWGRLAAYLEQSTRYIYFDQKNKEGKYRYFVPEHFDKKTKTEYIKTMDKIFDTYSEMVHALTEHVRKNSKVPAKEQDGAWKAATRAQACDTIRPVLPVATKSTVGIFGSAQAIESLIMHLQSENLPEAQTTGDKILKEVRHVSRVFFERADRPDRGGAFVAYRSTTAKAVKKLVDRHLSDKHSTSLKPVTLTSVWPRNEIDIVPDMLYEHSGLSLKEIKDQTNKWTYDQKLEVFQSYMGERLNRRHRPGRALEKIHYSWDLVCDYGIFRDLQRHRMVDDLEWQQLTPRYGFEIPQLVQDAGLTEQFESCFDLSLQLYSVLQTAGYETEAQYATLLGHKMRWKLTFNAREAFQMLELRTSPQGHPGYRKLAKEMYDKIAETHPLIGQAMKFINQDEDPELTRLAAERYSQFKLDQLNQT